MTDLASPNNLFNCPLKDVEKFFNESIQLKHFGVEVKFLTDNQVLVKIPVVLPIHLGGAGPMSVNGGIISFLIDLALGLTAYTVKANNYSFCATSRINIELKKSLRTESIFVHAKVSNTKKNLIYSEAWIEDDHGLICASAKGILFTRSLPSKIQKSF